MKKHLNHILILLFLTITVLTISAGCGNKDTAGTVIPDLPVSQSVSGKLVTAIAGVATEEAHQQAIEEVVSQGFSLGLVDDDGKQLNHNVPENAVSLSPVSVGTYAMMEIGGHYRTVEYVVDFLADAGIELESTGSIITVKDFLPDLQAYVNWSFENPDEPTSALGIMIASGQDLVVPDSPPILSGSTFT